MFGYSSNLKPIPSNFFRFLSAFSLAIILLTSHTSTAQSGVGANFEIEADVNSGTLSSGVDDWFAGATGAGVIDVTNAATYQAQLAALNNIAFDLRQSLPNFSVSNGYIWYSARYGHDYYGNVVNDQTIFTAGSKNADNPATQWGISSAPIAIKSDLIDAFVHMRRDGVTVTDDLWVDLGLTTFDSSGNHFVDFELFVQPLQTSGSNFTNVGTAEGHTDWQFDASGNVTQIGDLIIGFSYSGSGVAGLEVRLWVDKSIFTAGGSPGPSSGFTWGANLDGSSPASLYGYAQIVVPAGAILSNVNTTVTAAPPWGTYSLAGTPYSTTFGTNSLAEVGINFTSLGFDPGTIFGTGSACKSPFQAMLVKSRASSAFTSNLIDFAGPYDFLVPTVSAINTAITDPGVFDSCDASPSLTLQAEFVSAAAEYTWTSLTAGVTFPGGDTVLTGLGSNGFDSVVINAPGEYELNISPLAGCNADKLP
jgi:hypothetical protein